MTNLADGFLEWLRCPRTGETLQRADADLLTEVNARLTGLLENTSREIKPAAVENLTAGLVCSSRRFVYPIREGIAILLADEAISL